MADVVVIGYAYTDSSIVYVDLSTWKKRTETELPISTTEGLYFLIDERLRKQKSLLDHPHTIVSYTEAEHVEDDDLSLIDPQNVALAAECLHHLKSIPEKLSHIPASTFLGEINPEVLLRTLGSNSVTAPANYHPSLTFLDEKDHVLCKVHDWYETLAVIVSEGRYIPGTLPNVLHAWLSKKRGSKRIPFQAYFVSVLYELGMPSEGVLNIFKEGALVMTQTAVQFVLGKCSSSFSSVQELEPDSAVIRLGKWDTIPSVIIDSRESAIHDWSSRILPLFATPFAQTYVNRALSGGPWVKTDKTRALAESHVQLEPAIFFKRLQECMGLDNFMDSDQRPNHEKLLDYAWTDSLCIPLQQVDLDSGDVAYVNIPWRTCCIYQLPHSNFETAAIEQLMRLLENREINTH